MRKWACLLSAFAILTFGPFAWAQSSVVTGGLGFRGRSFPGVRLTPRGAPFHRGAFHSRGQFHRFRSSFRSLRPRFGPPLLPAYGGFYPFSGYYPFYSPYFELNPYPYEYVPPCGSGYGYGANSCAGQADESSGYGDAAFHIISPEEAAAARRAKPAPGSKPRYPGYVLLRFGATETAPGSSGNPLVIPPYPHGDQKLPEVVQ